MCVLKLARFLLLLLLLLPKKLSSGEKADDFSLSSLFSRAVSRAYFVNTKAKRKKEKERLS